MRFGRSTYRPHAHDRGHGSPRGSNRTTKAQEARTSPHAMEAQVRDAIHLGMEACMIALGTFHPFGTFNWASPLGGYEIVVSRCSTGEPGMFATCAQYYGPLGHWYTFIGYGQGTLFCLEAPQPP